LTYSTIISCGLKISQNEISSNFDPNRLLILPDFGGQNSNTNPTTQEKSGGIICQPSTIPTLPAAYGALPRMPTATRTNDRSVGASGTGDLRAVQVDQRMEKKKAKRVWVKGQTL
jgi:hypothetical protein